MMGLLEVLEWKLPVRSKTLVLVNLSAFVCVYQTQIPPNTQRMGALPYQSGSFLTLCNGTLSFLAKKNGQHEEDFRYHFGSNFSVSTNQI